MPGRTRPYPWLCPDCRQPLGHVRRSFRSHPRAVVTTLTVNHRAVRIEQRITTWVVHCDCGGYRSWSDGRIEGRSTV